MNNKQKFALALLELKKGHKLLAAILFGEVRRSEAEARKKKH